MPVTDDTTLREILERETIAVVGCSDTVGKPAHYVPAYMLEHGYEILPVNPFAEEIFDRQAVDSLADLDDPVEIVCVFRPSEEVADVVDAALERDDDAVIWTQVGIVDDEAARRAEAAGRLVVQDRCLKVEHQRLQL
ncbi:CoA-binding protein [Natronosalvus vescus]|uniref:CoA-binding protein n=1 Tax=Natronosalvus vescus TaxID=2953881 RepID=UPI002090CCCB|nr:CoA-binding protein [Natronosalvus vescus]